MKSVGGTAKKAWGAQVMHATIKAVERLNPPGGGPVPGTLGHNVQQTKCPDDTAEHYDPTSME